MLTSETRRSWVTLLCLGTLYSVWGSTYLAIRVAVVSFAPFQMASLRFLSAGVLLYAILRARGALAPTAREWRSCAAIGALMMACGLGGASLAMTHVSSGVAALVFGSVPMWTALFERFFGGRLRRREALGMLIGFTGLALVAVRGQLRTDPVGAVELGVAAAAYSLGCAVSRRLPQPVGAMSVAAQMVVAGVILAAVSIVLHDPFPKHVSLSSAIALAHLAVLGSMVAYTALNHLLRTVRPSLATSYAFVNPVVALGLGALAYREPVGRVEVAAVTLVLCGVAVVASASWDLRAVKQAPASSAEPLGDFT